jgi:hypothetical protein
LSKRKAVTDFLSVSFESLNVLGNIGLFCSIYLIALPKNQVATSKRELTNYTLSCKLYKNVQVIFSEKRQK